MGELGFGGQVAAYYARYRRGYPAEVVDALASAFGLTDRDAVLDLGCGTGQLALPLAARVGSVVGMDPEPDMLRLARAEGARRGVGNVSWVLGGDNDVPALGALLGGRGLAATVIGQALHWMRPAPLLAALRRVTRPGGGVAVLANGTPLWLQDDAWSLALRSELEAYFGRPLVATCGTAATERERYAEELRGAGFAEVRETSVAYRAPLSFDELVGGVCSALPRDRLPTDVDAFAARLRRALPPAPYAESVRVSTLVGLVGAGGGQR
ncbi:class I SAM-dependent methyltransferase [Streptomyces profundus]|uniref:class I SAM-dependent methyltransferase n=1 Tax=Streptomyces profundus TaxID=2867410 RepID=UPI001D168640|nr:class I SAM-dependent methyltransferase [Streptomyces sp. MA3_2.13]UED83882.1 methyltransferase domain-containing protein [Streptomyces sp. MA3_2.13]